MIETLEISPTIRDVICDEQPAYVIREAAEKEGMTTLQESARQLVLAGRTTVSEYSRLVQDVRWKTDPQKNISENEPPGEISESR